jgi:ABC-type dipeptide/oligopeptide/nickel transport system permease subunit
VVEPIFAWPGLGWLLVESIAARDFPVVVAGAIIAAVFVTLVNLIVDLLYITAVRALGGGDWRIMLRHMLPNTMAPILVVGGFQLGRLILLEATLSFLGLGVEPRTPAWGSMLSDARGYLNVAWWTATFPGIAIALVVLAANFMGDSLRDCQDPALRKNT